MGAGPLTGGGRGNCSSTAAGYARPGYGQGQGSGFRGGYGGGRGFAPGRGFGPGPGRRGFYPASGNAPYSAAPQDELSLLQNQAAAISNELDAINRRIAQLKSSPAE